MFVKSLVDLLVDFYRRLILPDVRFPALLLCSLIIEHGSLEIVWIQTGSKISLLLILFIINAMRKSQKTGYRPCRLEAAFEKTALHLAH